MVRVRVYTRANAAWATAAGHVVGGHPNFATIFGGRLPAIAQSERAEFGVGRRSLALCVDRCAEKVGSLPEMGGQGRKSRVGRTRKSAKSLRLFWGASETPGPMVNLEALKNALGFCILYLGHDVFRPC
jgi:hypothetical protein